MNPETGAIDPRFRQNQTWDINQHIIPLAHYCHPIRQSPLPHLSYRPIIKHIITTDPNGIIPIFEPTIRDQLPFHLYDFSPMTEIRVIKPSISSIYQTIRSSIPTIPNTKRIICFRNSLRYILSEQTFRIDIQRIPSSNNNNILIMRRYLSYNSVNHYDEGHQFELICRTGETQHAIGEVRSISVGMLEDFEIVCSSEIDILLNNGAPIELKCTYHRGHIHRQQNWIQCKLAGINTIVTGFKRDSADKTHTIVDDLVMEDIDMMYRNQWVKQVILHDLLNVLRFLDNEVCNPSSIYKLIRERYAGPMVLSEIIDGTTRWPII